VGAIGAFKANDSWPHFQVDYAGKVWQFLDTAVAAKSLRNLSGGVETNRDSAIQIEIVGFAAKPNEHPAEQMNALKALMRWLEANTGIKPVGPGKPFATSYGQNVRFTNAQWDSFNGWCGHCHVPENDHWDPGAIDINFLLSGAGSTPTPTPTPASSNYATEVPQVPFSLYRPQGGYIVVGGDGGIFAYDGAPFNGSLGGTVLNNPIIAAAYTPSGNGYWLMDNQGAIFSFGDAAYHGGFNALPPETKGNRKPIGIVAKGNGYRVVAFDSSNDGSPFDGYDFGV
jgi:hypothetical protein